MSRTHRSGQAEFRFQVSESDYVQRRGIISVLREKQKKEEMRTTSWSVGITAVLRALASPRGGASLCLQELPMNSETKDCSSEKCWERGARRDPESFGREPVILHVGILGKVPLLLICHPPSSVSEGFTPLCHVFARQPTSLGRELPLMWVLAIGTWGVKADPSQQGA